MTPEREPVVAETAQLLTPPSIVPGAEGAGMASPRLGIWTRGGRVVQKSLHGARSWLRGNAFIPSWLPARWRRPATGYVAAALMQIVATLVTLGLVNAIPGWNFPGALQLLVTVLIAVAFGRGPSLLAALLGGFLVDYVVLPPHFVLSLHRPEDMLGVLLYTLVGVAVSILPSQVERARQAAEEARDLSEADRARLRAVLDVLPIGVAVVDANGKPLLINDAVRMIWGQNLLIATNMAEYDAYRAWRAETGEQVADDDWGLTRALMRGETQTGEELDIETFDGRHKTIIDTAAPILDTVGTRIGAVSAIIDITERRRLEQRTRAALDALLAMAQTLVDPPSSGGDARDHGLTSDADPDDPERRMERAIAHRLAMLTCNVLGCSRVGILAVAPDTEALRAVTVVGLPSEQEQQWWAEQRVLEAKGIRLGEGADPEDLARFRAGAVFVLDMTQPPYDALPNPYGVTTQLIAPMRAGDRLVGMLSLDYGGPPHTFTAEEQALAAAVAQLGAVALERERLLREREEARANALALADANQRMDEFLGIAGHELRTPLTSIIANIQLVQRRLAAMQRLFIRDNRAGPIEEERRWLEQAQQMLERTNRQGERLNRLVSDLLDVSRIQAGKLEINPERFDLQELVREIVEEQRQMANGRAIRLHASQLADIPVFGDPDRIGQALTNYLTNALKYSATDQPVEVELRADDQQVYVAVLDEGPGLSQEEQDHIWDRFHRVPGIAVQSGSGVGLGLGLHISKTIIERHGGAVGVESAPGKGSVFWFTLPQGD